MDLIYTNAAKEDQGVLFDYEFDLAFGADENTFECTIPAEKHCCEAGSFLYIEGTEYGGIVDSIKVDTEKKTITYLGRTWHGILEGAVIQPFKGETEVQVEEEKEVTVSLLPEGYTELNCIESTGTQYINTDLVTKSEKFRVECEFCYTTSHASSALFGNQTGTNASTFAFSMTLYGAKPDIYVGSSAPATSLATEVGKTHKLILEANNGTLTINLDGTVTKTTYSGKLNHTLAIALFGNNISGTVSQLCSAKIKSWIAYDNDVLVRNYIPCISDTGAVGLYDAAGKKFYGNSGTGDFVAGVTPRELPDGYTQVECIESTGTQYTDTGFKPNNNTRVDMKAAVTSTSSTHVLFGSRNAAGSAMFYMLIGSGNFKAYYNTSSSLSFALTTGAKNDISMAKEKITVNGESGSYTNAAFQCNYSMPLFALKTADTIHYYSSIKLYECQIYDNGTLVRDYVPCINPGGEVGLYDLVNSTFYGNSGTGTFTAGEEVVCASIITTTETVITTKTAYVEYGHHVVSGEGNAVLAGLIEYLGLADIFTASEEDSGIHIASYFFRYAAAYSGICKMLAEFEGKLKLKHDVDRVILYTEPLLDFSQDEEFDSSQVDFTIQKNFRPVNHLICLGSGELKERHVIHLFTDENGGVQPYKTTENPVEDADYILDQTGKLLTGVDEVAEVLNYSSAQTVENFVKLSVQPSDWAKNYANYFRLDENDIYVNVEGIPSEVITALAEQPEDWLENYASYFFYENGKLKSVEAVTMERYRLQSAKPADWEKNYKNYFTRSSNGVSENWNAVNGDSAVRYVPQTMKPSDWETNYQKYFRRNPRAKGFVAVEPDYKWSEKQQDYIERTPKWEPNRYFTEESYAVAPQWEKNTYYTQFKVTSVPGFVSGCYYTKQDVILTPSFLPNVTFRKTFDHYAELVKSGLERLKQSLNRDSVDIDLDLEGNYDIGDIVGAAEQITGIAIWQPITKKIVTIKDGRTTISYKVGD